MQSIRDLTLTEIVDQYVDKHCDTITFEQREQVLNSIEFLVTYSFDEAIEDAIMGVQFKTENE